MQASDVPQDEIVRCLKNYNLSIDHWQRRLKRKVLLALHQRCCCGEDRRKGTNRKNRKSKGQAGISAVAGVNNVVKLKENSPPVADLPPSVASKSSEAACTVGPFVSKEETGGINNIYMLVHQIRSNRATLRSSHDAICESANCANLSSTRSNILHQPNLLHEYKVHSLLAKYFSLLRSHFIAGKLRRARQRLKRSMVNDESSTRLVASSTRNFHVADIHCERIRKRRGLRSFVFLLKRYNQKPNNFSTNYVAPPAHSQEKCLSLLSRSRLHRNRSLASICACAFKWIVCTLPPNTYTNR